MKIILVTFLGMILMNIGTYSLDNYIIYDTHKSKIVNIDDMVKSSLEYDVIFFGEFHDDSLNHYLQSVYLNKFFESNKNTIVSLEMFEKDVQKQIDSYFAGDINEEEFLKNSRPWPDYKKFYSPLVESAKSNNSKVIAANIPRKYASMYVSGGMSAFNDLANEEKSFIAHTLVLTEDDYLNKFLETMVGSEKEAKELNHNKLNTLYLYYGAQCIKDETMAESILDYYNSHKNSKIIHFNGDFHSNSYLGTAAMLKRRKPDLKIAVITPNYFSKKEDVKFDDGLSKQGNFILFIPEKQKEEMPQMMGGPTHFGENYAVEHNLKIMIDPKTSFLEGEDIIKFKNPVLKATSIKMLNTLKVKEVKDKINNLKFSVKQFDELYNEIVFENESLKNQTYQNGGIKESFEVVVRYEGKVYFPPSETTLIKRHSNTVGIISPEENEGIYLPGGSFYPQTDKDLAKFKAIITLPKDYKLITSGEITSTESGNKIVYSVESNQFLDELILVAGKYQEILKEHDGIKFGIYYYKDAPQNRIYLDESVKYYNEYTKLFGKYPYKSFNIVENFFATGFGMPSYTLLSDKLMAMPWVTLSPGSLAHEFVHNWWGNSVFVDHSAGNWCEALTTFSTNYYYNVITNKKMEEIDWRRKALIAIESLPEEKNYPVNDFEYQKDTYDAVIGYSKGAFIFQEIMKLIGKDKFFEALKSFSTKYSGKRAFWMNLTGEFVDKTKDTLKDIKLRTVINDWLKTKNIPEIKLSDTPVINNDSVTISIQSNIKRVLSLPISIYYKSEKDAVKHYVILKDTLNSFTLPISSDISKIIIDEELETLRKIEKWEKPTSFNQVLSSKPIVILPDKSSPDFKIAMEYVQSLKTSGFEFDYNTAENFSKEDIKFSSLILLGNTSNNKYIAQYSNKIDDDILLDATSFKYGDKSTNLVENVLLANIEHPENMDKFCSIISFSGLTDVKPLNRLIHYQTYSLVLLNLQRTGRPAYSREIFPKAANKDKLIWVK